MKNEIKKSLRLEIAISLLKGHIVKKHRDGYDPIGLYIKEVDSLVKSALHIADRLIEMDAKVMEDDEGDE